MLLLTLLTIASYQQHSDRIGSPYYHPGSCIYYRNEMGFKARFLKQSTELQIATHSIDGRGSAIETKLGNKRTLTDDDTASTRSASSDISPIGIGITEEQPKEESTLLDSANNAFLSTLCCHGGSLQGDEDGNDLKESNDSPRKEVEFGEDEGFLSKLTGTLLYIIGQAPPVQLVKCLEDRSVDQSEVSLPQVLTDMAEEYDQTQLKIKLEDKTLKEQYEKQQQSSKRRMLPKLPKRGNKGSSRKSTSATISSNSSFFEKLKKSPSQVKQSSPMYEV